MPLSRNTLQRQLVLQAVRELHGHPTADEVYSQVVRAHPSISKATVYRNLAFLAKRGEIRRVSYLDAADRFDFTLEAHHHFICKGCGRVFDVDLPYDTEMLGRPKNPAGFLYEDYALTFSGLCPECNRTEKQ